MPELSTHFCSALYDVAARRIARGEIFPDCVQSGSDDEEIFVKSAVAAMRPLVLQLPLLPFILPPNAAWHVSMPESSTRDADAGARERRRIGRAQRPRARDQLLEAQRAMRGAIGNDVRDVVARDETVDRTGGNHCEQRGRRLVLVEHGAARGQHRCTNRSKARIRRLRADHDLNVFALARIRGPLRGGAAGQALS